jgi:hypothetical protein
MTMKELTPEQLDMKFNVRFYHWSKTNNLDDPWKDPDIRRLCRSCYDFGYHQGRRDALTGVEGRCPHGVPFTEYCLGCEG